MLLTVDLVSLNMPAPSRFEYIFHSPFCYPYVCSRTQGHLSMHLVLSTTFQINSNPSSLTNIKKSGHDCFRQWSLTSSNRFKDVGIQRASARERQVLLPASEAAEICQNICQSSVFKQTLNSENAVFEMNGVPIFI